MTEAQLVEKYLKAQGIVYATVDGRIQIINKESKKSLAQTHFINLRLLVFSMAYVGVCIL